MQATAAAATSSGAQVGGAVRGKIRGKKRKRKRKNEVQRKGGNLGSVSGSRYHTLTQCSLLGGSGRSVIPTLLAPLKPLEPKETP